MLDNLKGKNVLITGGLGFIGSNIARRLLEYGAGVTILDSMVSMYGANYFNVEDVQHNITIELGDARDYLFIERLVRDKDYIIHLAAQVSYIDSRNMPVEDMDINCRSMLNVLEASKKVNPGVRIGFSSTRMVYGKIQKTPTDEEHPTKPLSLYGIHKLTCERYLNHYYQDYGIKSVIFRISNPYGPRQQMKHSKYSIVGWFIRMAMEGKKIQIFGDGSQIRDYIYIEDLVERFLLGLTNDDIHCEIFNLGSGTSTPFIEMVQSIIDVVENGSIKKVPWPDNYERLETGDYVSDQTKTQKILKLNSSVSIKEGIQKTFEYYRDNRTHYW